MKIKILLCVFAIICIIVLSFLGIYFMYRHLYNKTANNPPNINEIEEELEDIFLTRDVCVLNIEETGNDYIICKVKANGFYYLVLYKIATKSNYYCWEYVRHTEIKEQNE